MEVVLYKFHQKKIKRIEVLVNYQNLNKKVGSLSIFFFNSKKKKKK